MKTAIVYASVHHGNTKKIIDEIQTVEKDLSEGFRARDLIRSDRSS